MAAWLWEAGEQLGITDDEERAMDTAAACLAGTGTARVELARLTLGPDFTNAYERTGLGWAGRASAGRVTWRPFAEYLTGTHLQTLRYRETA